MVGNVDQNPAYDYLKVLDVPRTYLLETGKFHYKFEKNLLPTRIGNYFKTSADEIIQHHYNLRSCSGNKPTRFISRSKSGEKSVQFKGSQIWKSMPPDIRNCESLSMTTKMPISQQPVENMFFNKLKMSPFA